jgi:hypothetical protein
MEEGFMREAANAFAAMALMEATEPVALRAHLHK